MKYKVGDKVRVKEDLVVGNRYGTQAFIEDMKKYSGKTMTISRASSNTYYFKEDKDEWFWTDEMIEGKVLCIMKYRVGDKVKVRQDLVTNKRYGNDTFILDMKPYLGKIMTIDKITDKGKYKLKEDNVKWNWTDEMLEDVEEGIDIIVDGNKVIAKKDNKVGIARCSPEDEFDIFIGTKLAIDRLEEKCKPYSWLKKGVIYYVPDVIAGLPYQSFTYGDNPTDKRMISLGLVFKTKEKAIEVAKKMLEVLK